MSLDKHPLTIGGMGGSGTRLVAKIINKLGYYLGDDLGTAHDNLFFTLLFKRKNILLENTSTIAYSLDLLIGSLRGDYVFSAADIKFIRALSKGGRHHHHEAWLAARVCNVLDKPVNVRRKLIAWKEPNSHVILEQLLKHKSQIKYLHVVRDGLDMAFSGNQQQLLLWGDCYLNRPVSLTPTDALHYWNAIHNRIFSIKAQYPDSVEIVSYDRICQRHAGEIEKLCEFADIDPSDHQQGKIDALIQPPKTLGRAKNMNMSQFDSEAVKQYKRIMQLMHDSLG